MKKVRNANKNHASKVLTNLCFGLAICVLLLANGMIASACTGVYVGKKVSANGSTIISRSEDIDSAHPKCFVVKKAAKHKAGSMFEDSYGFSMPYPSRTCQYTACFDASKEEGEDAFAEVGHNEYGVAVTATVSADAGEAAQKADPYVETGICEISMGTVILQQARSAREGVELLASIVDKYGAGEGNIVMIADQKEAWYMEILTGHQYIAIKMPEDKVAVFPNCFMLGKVNVKSKDVIASKNLVSLAKKHNFLSTKDGQIVVAKTYGDGYGEGNVYRIYGGQKLLNPSINVDVDQDFYDLFFKPAKKVTVKETMNVLRCRNEGTKYDPTTKGNEDLADVVIGNERQAECHVLEVRPNVPAKLAGLEWLCMGNSEFSVFLPYYGSLITDTANSSKNDSMTYNPNSSFWAFRSLSALCGINRDLFGKNVKAYWSDYQDALIKQQEAVDKKMLTLYKIAPKVAAKKATKLGKEVTTEAISRAQSMFYELITYFAMGQGETQEDAFTPSCMTNNVLPNYRLK
ncbi:probable dipeptidase B [Lachnospiraceae bacterium KM106-2]|nr:probable dipeptidase B [Lachnospiraceae bacterium KM106-2]